MVLTEYSHKLILKYFISAVDEFQNIFLEFDFGFQAFGPHSACRLTLLPKKDMSSPRLSPGLPPRQCFPPRNWSGAVADQVNLGG